MIWLVRWQLDEAEEQISVTQPIRTANPTTDFRKRLWKEQRMRDTYVETVGTEADAEKRAGWYFSDPGKRWS